MLRLSTTKQQVLNFLGIEDRTSGVSYKNTFQYKDTEDSQYVDSSAFSHQPVLTFHYDPYVESGSTSNSLPDIVINGVLSGIYKKTWKNGTHANRKRRDNGSNHICIFAIVGPYFCMYNLQSLFYAVTSINVMHVSNKGLNVDHRFWAQQQIYSVQPRS
ncbi:Sorting nexin-22 [Apis cerana cerana]|uniref:Sorting nexin-22 n=1 Tax=Apis cerana cerana TaxID=94128 RepID=A0A2A3ECC0_APICC|nr:Sorting nexin-22 [Apis cerana cerana]